MDRITKCIDDTHACYAICEKECPDGIYADNPACVCTASKIAMKRLLEYEDTGLTPEQIRNQPIAVEIAVEDVIKIIRAHLSCENDPEIKRSSRDNDGWIPVEERLPEECQKAWESGYDVGYAKGYDDGYALGITQPI